MWTNSVFIELPSQFSSVSLYPCSFCLKFLIHTPLPWNVRNLSMLNSRKIDAIFPFFSFLQNYDIYSAWLPYSIISPLDYNLFWSLILLLAYKQGINIYYILPSPTKKHKLKMQSIILIGSIGHYITSEWLQEKGPFLSCC